MCSKESVVNLCTKIWQYVLVLLNQKETSKQTKSLLLKNILNTELLLLSTFHSWFCYFYFSKDFEYFLLHRSKVMTGRVCKLKPQFVHVWTKITFGNKVLKQFHSVVEEVLRSFTLYYFTLENTKILASKYIQSTKSIVYV